MAVSILTVKHRTVSAMTSYIVTIKHITVHAMTRSIVTIKHRIVSVETMSIVHRTVCATEKSTLTTVFSLNI